MAIDAYVDPILKEQTIFITTRKSKEEYTGDYVINLVRLNETEFRKEKTNGRKVNQAKYHRQYRIENGLSQNCAN